MPLERADLLNAACLYGLDDKFFLQIAPQIQSVM